MPGPTSTNPPVIITTDLDDSTNEVHAAPTSAGSPLEPTHSTPPRPSAAHLSPNGNGHYNAPPSPTLTNNSSVHFSDEASGTGAGGVSPSSPAIAQRSSLALRDNQPGPDSGKDTLQVIGENDPVRHKRMWSVGTWSSAGGDEEKGQGRPGLQNVKSTGEQTLVDSEDGGKKGKKDKQKRGEFASSRLDPDNDTTDPTPFKEKPSRLAMMVDPKSLEELERIGGTKGLLDGLGVDPKRGLTTAAAGAGAGAPRGSGDMPGSGAQWSADLERRREIYGRNELPQRKGKSLLRLMWMAFQDKILVLLTIAAVVSLALGIYQASPAGPPHIVVDENCPEGCQVASLEWVEGVAIVVAIVIIVLVGSLTDFQKERQFQKLNAQREDRTVKVIRDGTEQQINTKDLVVGDVALLEPGEILPVDGVFLSGHNIRCDESGATGESDAIKKVSYEDCIAERDGLAPGGKRKLDCFLVSGAKVLEGVGSYVVISSGTNTFNGRIMMAMQGEAEATPLQVKLNGLAELIVYVGSTAGGLLFLALLIRFFVELRTLPDRSPDEKGQDFIKSLIISVVLIVAAVPEGLPLAVTLALAFATNRMTRQNLLVRVLGSCETMANATVVCTDKTGTLTQNVMTVVAGSLGVKGKFVRDLSENSERTNAGEVENARDDFSFDMSELNQVASPELQTLLNEAICINSTAFEDKNEKGELEFVGSKTETALLRFAKDLQWADYRKVREGAEVVQMIPFSSELKAMGVVVKQPDTGMYRLYAKGASEILSKNCSSHVVVNHKRSGDELGSTEFTDDTRENISRTIIFYANQSLRTLAMCYRDFESWPPKGVETNDAGDVEFAQIASSDLTLIAITGIEDPLRDGVREAVRQCHRAGVAIKMCTGDNVLTARSIANQCGIFTPGGIVMEGPVFRKLSPADRNEIVPRLQILARSSPEDKKLLVKTLKDQGEVVGVTGDGTNDGPALKLANVGFSMGVTGTEVAKTASDIILMDDAFSNIVVAIKTGRCVNDSVRKFVQFQLSVNVAAIILTFVSAVASNSDGAILSAVQLLWVNLIMDTFAALALATDPPTDSSLDRKPSRKSEPLINVDMAKMIVVEAIYQCIICFVLHFAGHQILGQESTPGNDAELRTLVFNVFVFCQIFNQINCRRLDRNYNVFEGFFKNYWFMGIFLIMCGGQVLIVEVGGAAFQVTRIYGRDWAISIIAGLISFPIGVIVRTLPTEPVYRWLIKMRIYQDPSKLPTITQEEEDLENEKYEYNPALENLRDNLKTYDTIRGGRIRGSSIVLKSRSKRLRDADIQLPTLLTMVPTVIAGTVGAGAHWLTQTTAAPIDTEKMADPASQDPSRSTAELFAGKVQMHPDTDPNDPLFDKFGIDPRQQQKL